MYDICSFDYLLGAVIIRALKKQPAGRIIVFGFLLVILIGSLLLFLPISRKADMPYIDCLYTATSAVCVTGLVVVDTGSSFTLFGQIIICMLIQIGGLGVASVGAGLIMAVGGRLNLKGRTLIREGVNFDSGKGIIKFLRQVLFTTFVIESVGAILSFFVFIEDYSFIKSVWLSIFHSIAAFNNAGFDILGTGMNLHDYTNHIPMNLITSALVILGGLGFLVIGDVCKNRFRFKKLRYQSKVVIMMTVILLAVGTVILKLTESHISWLGAFFASMTARTAGFATDQYSTFSNAGILIMCVLMFIGASSGSTGGGVKTGTLFVLFQGIRSAATNRSSKMFKHSIPKSAYYKATVIVMLGILIVIIGTILMTVFEPELGLIDILFEIVSAFATVGLSTGITGILSTASKILSICIMFIGRLGPLTIASLWYFARDERAVYPEGQLLIG